MLTKDERALLTALEALPRDYDSRSGVCEYLLDPHVSARACIIFSDLAVQWPEYSGRPTFPVPAWQAGQSPDDAYWHAVRAGGVMWDRKHPYGAARWRLVDWCIAELRARNAAPDKDART